jgi:peroxiredoxin/uncharacterized membrane protein YphA (DoxX/SURF4 family)
LDIALLIARVLLGALFLLAGISKLADRTGSRQAVVDFGVPMRLAGPAALFLPVAELAIGIALFPKRSAWLGALGALALLALFIGAIGFNLARGRKPDCHCFGQLHSAPAGWSTLGRNGALAGVAGFVVWQGFEDPGPSSVSWLGDLTAAQAAGLAGAVLGFGLLAVITTVLLNVMRQNGRLLLRIEALEQGLAAGGTPLASAESAAAPERGLPVGTPAPPFALPGLYGETLTLDALRAAGKPVLLVLTDPHCGPCNALLPEIGRWQREQARELTIAVISSGAADANRAKSGEHGLVNVLLQHDREVAEAYREEGTPSAVVVNADGTVGSALAAGADQIRALLAATAGAATAPPVPVVAGAAGNGTAAASASVAPSVGEPAPTLRLSDLNGRTVNLTGFRGTKTVVLFWNPGCGFCQQMLDDLRRWEADTLEGAPKLLVVSAGDAEANRAMGLRSPVLLDTGFQVGGTFGANGTPMAVLVDEEGRIGSELAVGAEQVLTLLGAPLADRKAAATATPRVGDTAPAIELTDLDGRTVKLSDFRGSETLVLFWNPGCGFCQQMLDDLKTWDASPPPGAPRLFVVSTGGVEENRALGLRSPVVLDQGFSVGGAFGANGTPMAVLVDADGRIASDVAAGAPAVLALARGENQAASATN